MNIRDARPDDAPQLSVLLEQLGYPSDAAEIPGRLKRMAGYTAAVARVAEENGRVVGLITAHIFPAIHATEMPAYITALVVDATVRSTGVGKQLLTHIEDWARSQGAVRITVTSATRRERAHGFYLKNGYEQTGVRLARVL